MTPYLHPDKQVSVHRVLVRASTKKAVKPKKVTSTKPKDAPAPKPSSGLVSALAAHMLAQRQSGDTS